MPENLYIMQVEKVTLMNINLDSEAVASRDLASFLCSLIHLKYLRFENNLLHDDFRTCLAQMYSDSKVNTCNLYTLLMTND